MKWKYLLHLQFFFENLYATFMYFKHLIFFVIEAEKYKIQTDQ